MTFITNYYYDLPPDMIEYITHIKQQLERELEKKKREFNVGDIFTYFPTDGNKYQITKVNKKTYQMIKFRFIEEPELFIKGDSSAMKKNMNRRGPEYLYEQTWGSSRYELAYTFESEINKNDKKIRKDKDFVERWGYKDNPTQYIKVYNKYYDGSTTLNQTNGRNRWNYN
jgi:hypothetical protein